MNAYSNSNKASGNNEGVGFPVKLSSKNKPPIPSVAAYSVDIQQNVLVVAEHGKVILMFAKNSQKNHYNCKVIHPDIASKWCVAM